MKLNQPSLHHIAADRELCARVALYLRKYTNWRYSWGMNSHIPRGVSAVLVPAEIFLTHRKYYPKHQVSFVELAYGDTKYLVSCYLAKCDDFLKNSWDDTELYYRISRLICREVLQLQNPFITVRPTFIEIESKLIGISAREYEILKILIQNIDQVVPRKTFNEMLFEKRQDENNRIIDVYICSIRRKLAKVLSREIVANMLQTVYSSGYRLLNNTCG